MRKDTKFMKWRYRHRNAILSIYAVRLCRIRAFQFDAFPLFQPTSIRISLLHRKISTVYTERERRQRLKTLHAYSCYKHRISKRISKRIEFTREPLASTTTSTTIRLEFKVFHFFRAKQGKQTDTLLTANHVAEVKHTMVVRVYDAINNDRPLPKLIIIEVPGIVFRYSNSNRTIFLKVAVPELTIVWKIKMLPIFNFFIFAFYRRLNWGIFDFCSRSKLVTTLHQTGSSNSYIKNGNEI